MKKIFISLGLILGLATSCINGPESDTHFTLYPLCFENQTQDSLVLTVESSVLDAYQVLLEPGDTVLTTMAISTDLNLASATASEIRQSLNKNFMSRKFDTCYASEVHLVGPNLVATNTIRWTKPFVEEPATTLHSFFNVNSWKIDHLFNRNVLLYTFTQADSVYSIH